MRSASPIWTSSLIAAALALAGCDGSPPAGNSPEVPAAGPNATAAIVTTTNAAEPANDGVATNAVAAKPAPEAKTAPAERKPPRSAGRPGPYRALGTEPFWSITVRGSSLVLERPDYKPETFPVRISGKGTALRFVGNGISMAVTPGPCNDGMSDLTYADNVQLTLAYGVLKGCGGGTIEPSDTDQ